MTKTVVVTCTKPQDSVIEYGVRDEFGNWIVHGVVVSIAVGSLSASDRSKVLGARSFLLDSAKAEARKRKRSENVTVVTTHPDRDLCIFSETGKENEPTAQVSTTFSELDSPGKTTISDIKSLFTSIATADATSKGYLT